MGFQVQSGNNRGVGYDFSEEGKNTVQAFVIFRKFIDGERSNVNQMNNDIKNRGVRQVGKRCKGYVG